jgi:L,D-peptidoglycan transpeptidase YkuD (ErfK/YbiS/YcfS/YnhG family)
VNSRRRIMHTARGHLQLVVRTTSPNSSQGHLQCGWQRFRCALGRSGRTALKREGDGASPTGTWPLRHAYYRADRLIRPQSGLPLRPLDRSGGWCDAPADRNYNRRVAHPYPASAEQLWRTDGLYDVLVVLGHNDVPRIRGLGSAIFLHCARDDFAPTAGCIAVRRRDLVALLARLDRHTTLRIG